MFYEKQTSYITNSHSYPAYNGPSYPVESDILNKALTKFSDQTPTEYLNGDMNICSKVNADTQHLLAYPEQSRQLQHQQHPALHMDSLKLQTSTDSSSCDVPQQQQQQNPILTKVAADIKKNSKNNSLQSPSSASCSSSFVSSDDEDFEDDKNSSQPSWLQQGI